MSYTTDYGSVDYEYIKESPRTYVGKYFGNDRGLSLKAVTAQGYIDHPGQAPQVFESNRKVENFTNGIDNRRVTQKYLSEREKSWPHKYYENSIGHSLRAITKDEGIPEIEQFRDFSLNPKYPITQRYGPQGTIKDLLSSKEEYSNYHRRPFRDGYEILQKTSSIRSGPLLYNSNKMGHSLKAIIKAEGGLTFSN